jgi:hypothetical protein
VLFTSKNEFLSQKKGKHSGFHWPKMMILAEKQGNNSDFNSNDLDWTFISKTGI